MSIQSTMDIIAYYLKREVPELAPDARQEICDACNALALTIEELQGKVAQLEANQETRKATP